LCKNIFTPFSHHSSLVLIGLPPQQQRMNGVRNIPNLPNEITSTKKKFTKHNVFDNAFISCGIFRIKAKGRKEG